MKSKNRFLLGSILFVAVFGSVSPGGAQAQKPVQQNNAVYTLAREVSLVGTVVKYDPGSATPPMGAHVLLQTSWGQVDVHLGKPKLLEANHLTLNAGDTVRIVGESMSLGDGSYFAARIVQKGVQALAVRNARGFLVSPIATLTPAQREALRGAR